jgi:hypothetical protein
MLASITPLGERGRRNRWSVTAGVYMVGVVAGGAVLGAVAGAAGHAVAILAWPSASPRLLITAVLAVAALALDLSLGGLRLPTVRRQVNEDWLATYRGWVYGFGFGVQLGVGLVTIVSTAAVYLAVAVAFLSGSLTGGLLIGAAFGLARALPLLATRRVTTPGALGGFHRRLDAWRPRAHATTITAEGLLVIASLSTVLARAR